MVRGLYEQNIALLIFSFVLETNKLNESDNFGMDDWSTMLDLMKKYMVDSEKEVDKKSSGKVSYAQVHQHLSQMV